MPPLWKLQNAGRNLASMSFVFTVLAVASAGNLSAADEQPLSEDELERVEQALVGLQTGRQKLLSGAYRAHLYDPRGEEYPEEVSHQYIYSSFDMRSGKLRFDRNTQVQIIEFPDGVPADRDAILTAPRRLMPLNAKFIKTPENTLRWGSNYPHQIDTGGANDGDPKSYPFYVHTMGVMSGSSTKLFTIEELLEQTRKQRCVALDEQGDIISVTWVNDTENFQAKSQMWIDRSRDYVPQRLVMWIRPDETAQWGEPYYEMTSEWIERNGAWIPQKIERRVRFGRPDSKVMRTADRIEFEWLSVNEPVDEKDFTARGFDLDMFAAVVDKQLGRRTVTETVGPRPITCLRRKPCSRHPIADCTG